MINNFIIFLAITLIGISCSETTQSIKTINKFSILTTSDLQSHIVPFLKKIDGKEIYVGGFEKIAAYKKLTPNTNTLLLSSGDDFIGNFYHLFGGLPEIKGMNLAGYDVVTPGNHEFDYGIDNYKNAILQADFDIVSANLHFDDHQIQQLIKKYVIKKFGDITIGLFGLMTPELLRVANTGLGVSVDNNIFEVANSIVSELQSKNCDIIIAITHIGTELDKQLAENVSGIDLIVGGHSHEYVYEQIKHQDNSITYIIQDGMAGSHIGQFDFEFNDGKITNPSWNTILLDSTFQSDPIVKKEMIKYWQQYLDSTSQPVGVSLVDLDARENIVRFQESNLGNLITDSWVNWFPDVNIAIINSGSIRSDKIYPKGNITYNDLITILPFSNEIYTAKLSGKDLKQILEINASALRTEKDTCPEQNRAAHGGFLQVSGLKFTIDTTQHCFCAEYNGRDLSKMLFHGNRISNVKVYQNSTWEDLDMNKEYEILLVSWLSAGGDGYYIFKQPAVKLYNTTLIDADILSDYIRKNSPVSPKVEGRINFK